MMEQKSEKQLEKLDAIKQINIQQINMARDMTELAMKPNSPYPKVNRRRAFELMTMLYEIRALSIQIDIIKAQPIPDFANGGVITLNGKDEL